MQLLCAPMSDHPHSYPVVNGGKAPEWKVAEKLASPGFDRRTVQPIASRYTKCPTPARTWEDAIGNSVTFPFFSFSFFLSLFLFFFLSSFLPSLCSFFLCFVHKNHGRVFCYILTFDILVEKVSKICLLPSPSSLDCL